MLQLFLQLSNLPNMSFLNLGIGMLELILLNINLIELPLKAGEFIPQEDSLFVQIPRPIPLMNDPLLTLRQLRP